MKARKWIAAVMTFLLLMTAMPGALADEFGTPVPTDTYCPYEPTNTHGWSEWRTTSEPTCTREGSQFRDCRYCDYRQTRAIPKKGHDYGSWKTTREATCTQAGEQKRTCRVCGHEDKRTVDRLPHTWGEWTVLTEPTDHSAGERTHTCQVCGTESTEAFDPEGTLRRGAKGDAVKALQEGLICAGALSGRADGSFGPATEKAVTAFQEIEGLTADGVAWPQTQAHLGHVFGPWTTVSELTDFSVGVRERTCERCGHVEREEEWPAPMYRRGDKGDGVKALQQALNDAGFDCGSVDGDFGGKTERAVSAFEEAHDIEPDGIAWPGVLKLLGLAGSPLDHVLEGLGGGVNLRIGGSKTAEEGAVAIEVMPGAITHTGYGDHETILAEIIVTNIGSKVVVLTDGFAVGMYNDSTEAGVLRSNSADGPWIHDAPIPLEPGESVMLWLDTYLRPEDLAYGSFYRVVQVSGFAEDYTPPGKLLHVEEYIEHAVADTCVLMLPIHPVPGQKLRLTQGNVAVAGEGIDSRITVALRAENLSDEPLTVSMHHFTPDGEEYDSHFVEWLDDGGGFFTLEPHGALDFGVLFRPFPGEAEEEFVSRVLEARPLEGEAWAALDVMIPLGEYTGLRVEGAAAEEPQALKEGAPFRASLTAVNPTQAAIESVRFLGEVLDSEGQFLGALESVPEDDAIPPLGTATAELEYELTEEDAKQDALTFVIWAYGEVQMGEEGAHMPILSYNVWQYTVPAGGPAVATGDMSLSLSLSEGDRLYKTGEPIPLDISVSAIGDHALNELQIWVEPAYTGTDDYIYDYFGDLQLDTVSWDENSTFISLEPGEPWNTSWFSGLILPESAAQLGSFDIRLFVDAVDSVTGEYIERTARVHVRTIDNDAGMVLITETDTERYRPLDAIVYRVGIRNEGKDPLRDVEVWCRRGTKADALRNNWVEVVMDLDEPIQPGETVWREEFLCWPTSNLEGGEMYVRFTASTWYGFNNHALTDRMLTYMPAKEVVYAPGSLAFEVDTNAAGFLPGVPIEFRTTTSNLGETELALVNVYGGPGVPEDGKDGSLDIINSYNPLASGEVGHDTHTYVPTQEDQEKGTLQLTFGAAAWLANQPNPCDEIWQTIELTSADEGRISLGNVPQTYLYSPGDLIDFTAIAANVTSAELHGCVLECFLKNREEIVATHTEEVSSDGEGILGPGKSVDVPVMWTDLPDGIEDGWTILCRLSGRDEATDTLLTDEQTCMLITEMLSGEGALTMTCSFDRDTTHGANEAVHATVILRNDSQAALGPVALNLNIDRPGSSDPETRFLESWENGLAPGESVVHVCEYHVTPEDVSNGRVQLTFAASSEPTVQMDQAEVSITRCLYTLPSEQPTDAALSLDGWIEADGEEVVVRLTMSNAGKRDLTQVSASALLLDETGGVIADLPVGSWLDLDFAPGDAIPFSWAYNLTEEDIAHGNMRIVNIVRAVDAQSQIPVFDELPLSLTFAPLDQMQSGALLTLTTAIVGQGKSFGVWHSSEVVKYVTAVANHSQDPVGVTVYAEREGGGAEVLGNAWILPGECEAISHSRAVGPSEASAGEMVEKVYAIVDQTYEGSGAFHAGDIFHAAPAAVPTA